MSSLSPTKIHVCLFHDHLMPSSIMHKPQPSPFANVSESRWSPGRSCISRPTASSPGQTQWVSASFQAVSSQPNQRHEIILKILISPTMIPHNNCVCSPLPNSLPTFATSAANLPNIAAPSTTAPECEWGSTTGRLHVLAKSCINAIFLDWPPLI